MKNRDVEARSYPFTSVQKDADAARDFGKNFSTATAAALFQTPAISPK